MDVTELLSFAHSKGASDIHVMSGHMPNLRIDGEVTPLKMEAMEDSAVRASIYDIMSDKQRSIFEEHMELDFSFEIKGLARFRANVFQQKNGMSVVFRTIPSQVLTLEQLRCPPKFKEIAEIPRGLVLVTGPTGSGKSTTLAAMVDYINKTDPCHILTIEDPIEFVYTPQKSIINQRELGPHTHSFANALKSALRQDPDVILIGEMRDLETIRLALSAAETGHLVFGTLHTSSAPKTIDRIIDVFPAAEKEMIRSMLSESLRAVISQTLLKKEGGGRVAAHEILIANSAIKNLIRENKIPQMTSVMQTSKIEGMQVLDNVLVDMVRRRVVSKEEALKKANNKKMFENVM